MKHILALPAIITKKPETTTKTLHLLRNYAFFLKKGEDGKSKKTIYLSATPITTLSGMTIQNASTSKRHTSGMNSIPSGTRQ
ncbi:hypothetical protein CR164_00550 [Prosthecochloris marina]|uniref:Uncharacterized protein n=1 Tax=Prosthecochloris marina TaxID=2017681 RepID=A0A317TAZ9_9CHLB|nr:hypothetical protein CR164_00550 [Prosthecochloris marina]